MSLSLTAYYKFIDEYKTRRKYHAIISSQIINGVTNSLDFDQTAFKYILKSNSHKFPKYYILTLFGFVYLTKSFQRYFPRKQRFLGALVLVTGGFCFLSFDKILFWRKFNTILLNEEKRLLFKNLQRFEN